MAALHIVNGSPDTGALARCLYAASAGDVVLLIGSGVYFADASRFAGSRAKGGDLEWFVLADDVRASGVADRLSNDVTIVDDAGFVDLVVACQPIVSWS